MEKNEMSACENVERRKVVKGIVGGVSAITAYSLLPAKWNSPLIESVFLPAHAATSGSNNSINQNTNNGVPNNAFVGTWKEEGTDDMRLTVANDGTYSWYQGNSGHYTVTDNTMTLDSGNKFILGSDGNSILLDSPLDPGNYITFHKI